VDGNHFSRDLSLSLVLSAAGRRVVSNMAAAAAGTQLADMEEEDKGMKEAMDSGDGEEEEEERMGVESSDDDDDDDDKENEAEIQRLEEQVTCQQHAAQ